MEEGQPEDKVLVTTPSQSPTSTNGNSGSFKSSAAGSRRARVFQGMVLLVVCAVGSSIMREYMYKGVMVKFSGADDEVDRTRNNTSTTIASKVKSDAAATTSEQPKSTTDGVGGFLSNAYQYFPTMQIKAAKEEEEEPVQLKSLEEICYEAEQNAPEVVSWIGAKETIRFAIQGLGAAPCNVWRQRQTNATFLEGKGPFVWKIQFSGSEMFHAGHGTGNMIPRLYLARLVARLVGHTDVIINCTDAEQEKRGLITPWLSGYFPESRVPSPVNTSLAEDCPTHLWKLGYMLEELQYDLRRMAIAMVGIPYKGHPSKAWGDKYLWSKDLKRKHEGFAGSIAQVKGPQPGDEPFYPNVTIDDAIVHFRCGDLMNIKHPSFGFIKFFDLAKNISPEARTIGIVTQPFSRASTQVRVNDAGNGERCRPVVMAFVDYIQKRHPNSVVTIHNDPNETIALTYARMIMSNQTITAISSFSSMPAISTFGTGYLRIRGYAKAPNGYLENPPIETFGANVVWYPAPEVLYTGTVSRMWQTDPTGKSVLDWFLQEGTE